MRATTADWLAEIITTHSAGLAADLTAFAQQMTPGPADRDGIRLPDGMGRYFAALTQALTSGDLAPLRLYLEQTVPLRIQAGTDGSDCIQLINYAEDLIQALIGQEATDPDQGTDAQRLARSMGRNARLIVSEINLQLLVNPAHYDETPTRLPLRVSPSPAA